MTSANAEISRRGIIPPPLPGEGGRGKSEGERARKRIRRPSDASVSHFHVVPLHRGVLSRRITLRAVIRSRARAGPSEFSLRRARARAPPEKTHTRRFIRESIIRESPRKSRARFPRLVLPFHIHVYVPRLLFETSSLYLPS